MSNLETDIWDRDYDFYSQDSKYENKSQDIDFEKNIFLDDQEDFLENNINEEESIIDNARIRLEQGRLYEMLIKHDLFEGVDANPKAVQNVQKEIKNFIMERLEILLGMRVEKEKNTDNKENSDFNDIEVKALKMIASKVTKGVSEKESVNKQNLAPKNELNTVKTSNKKNKLNSLNKKNTIKQINTGKKLIKKQKSVKNKLENNLQKNVALQKNVDGIKEVSAGNVSVNEAAKRDIKYIESLKNMSLEEANKVVSERHSRPRPKVEINQDTVNAHYRTRMATNEVANTFTALLAMAKKK